MQWILQDFEDNQKIADILDRVGIEYSWHKVVPFVGELDPKPVINQQNVIMIGSYSLRHYASQHGLTPGVFEIRPFLHEHAWQPHLLNGLDSKVIEAQYLGSLEPDTDYFIRPLDDSKAISGRVMTGSEVEYMVRALHGLKPEEYVRGGLTPETLLMVCEPINIQQEWRTWVVDDEVVAYSLYRLGHKIIYRREMDDDALAFAREMVKLNPGYSGAYVLDICRCDMGLKIIETNCLNAAGFYAGDLFKIVEALEIKYA